jgi:hypothetical protein
MRVNGSLDSPDTHDIDDAVYTPSLLDWESPTLNPVFPGSGPSNPRHHHRHVIE